MVFPFLMSIISCVSVVCLYLPGHLSVAILKQKWTYYFCLRAQRKYLSILIILNHQPLHAWRDALKTITPLKSHEQCFKVSMQGSAVLRAVQQSFWMSKASGSKHHNFFCDQFEHPKWARAMWFCSQRNPWMTRRFNQDVLLFCLMFSANSTNCWVTKIS